MVFQGDKFVGFLVFLVLRLVCTNFLTAALDLVKIDFLTEVVPPVIFGVLGGGVFWLLAAIFFWFCASTLGRRMSRLEGIGLLWIAAWNWALLAEVFLT